MWGQSTVGPEPCWRGGGGEPGDPGPLEPPTGAVVLGAVDGSGLAADTIAAAPPTRSSAESAAVTTVRRMPEAAGREAAAIGSMIGVGTVTGADAGATGGVVHSIESPSCGMSGP